MKNFTMIIFSIMFSSVLFGQSKAQIASDKIASIKTYEQALRKGIDRKYIVEELTYDSDGRLIEQKEISGKGEIKLWKKYKFDETGNIVEEIEFDVEGKLEKKEITHYTNNLRTHKEYFDSKGRKYKIKSYEYKFHQ